MACRGGSPREFVTTGSGEAVLETIAAALCGSLCRMNRLKVYLKELSLAYYEASVKR